MIKLNSLERLFYDWIAEDYKEGGMNREKVVEVAREMAAGVEAILSGNDRGVEVKPESVLDYLRSL